jgi:hypothetical protein
MTKTTHADAFFEELSTAKTSAEFGTAIQTISLRMMNARARVTGLEEELEQAVFTGRDRSAIEAGLADVRRELETLEVAQKGAERRRAEAEKREAEDEKVTLLEQARALAAEFADGVGEIARQRVLFQDAIMDSYETEERLDHMRARLEAAGVPLRDLAEIRPEVIKRKVVEAAVGPAPREYQSPGLTQTWRRIDSLFSGFVAYGKVGDTNVRRSRGDAVAHGRFGESRATRAKVLGALASQAKG